MAKEQIHNYLRTGIILATIIFAGGGWTWQIKGNTSKIAEVKSESVLADKAITGKVEKVVEKVHKIEVNQERDMALKENLLSTMVRLESKVDNISTEQTGMKVNINSTKIRVETLTKD